MEKLKLPVCHCELGISLSAPAVWPGLSVIRDGMGTSWLQYMACIWGVIQIARDECNRELSCPMAPSFPLFAAGGGGSLRCSTPPFVFGVRRTCTDASQVPSAQQPQMPRKDPNCGVGWGRWLVGCLCSGAFGRSNRPPSPVTKRGKGFPRSFTGEFQPQPFEANERVFR